jgi:uncharacterized protein YegP (UPF0339 family)
MAPKLKIINSNDGQFQYQVFRKEALVTSETYTRKEDAKRGFQDMADAVLLILYRQGKLKATLERLNLLQEA